MSARPVVDVTFRIAVDADALCIGVLASQVFLDSYATDGIRPSLAREVLEHLSTNAVSALLSNPTLGLSLPSVQAIWLRSRS
jgi:hypothetical protein